MAYKQSPANVLKGQMKNKAAGLMLKDSESGLMMTGESPMKIEKDPKDGVTVTAKKTTSQKKKDLLNLINAQGAYDRNRSQKVLPELGEIDSLNMVASGDRRGAQKMYGQKFEASKSARLPSSVTKDKRRELYKQAREIQGPRPSLNN
jgi:hypothetical protein